MRDLTCLKQGPRADPPPCLGRTWQQSLLGGEGIGVNRENAVIGGIKLRLAHYQGNQQMGIPLTGPLIRKITSWGLGQVRRKVSHVSKGVGEVGTGRAGDVQRAREQPPGVA